MNGEGERKAFGLSQIIRFVNGLPTHTLKVVGPMVVLAFMPSCVRKASRSV